MTHTEEKKYRVICGTPEEHAKLKLKYPNIQSYQESTVCYYLTWGRGWLPLHQWNGRGVDYADIVPISFQEWQKDYYATNQLTNVDYDVY